MVSSPITLAVPRRTILQPLVWVLRSGWLSHFAGVVETEDDAEAASALRSGAASTALLDPVYWARNHSSLRPVPRSAVSLGPEATDLLLLSEVRLDGLERVTAPTSIAGTSEEVVARALVRDYYGVPSPLILTGDGAAAGDEGRIVTGVDALVPQTETFVESLSRAWWVMSGSAWLRALPVELSEAPVEPGLEALLKETARLLIQEAETVAAGLSRAGGAQDRWLAVVRALSLSYGADERKALSALLARAARLRMCPKIEDVALPRY